MRLVLSSALHGFSAHAGVHLGGTTLGARGVGVARVVRILVQCVCAFESISLPSLMALNRPRGVCHALCASATLNCWHRKVGEPLY